MAPLSKETVNQLIDARIADLSSTVRNLEKLVGKLQQNISTLQFQQEKTAALLELLSRRIDDNDQYSRRLNIIISEIPIQQQETPPTIREAVLREIRRLKVPLQDFEISRAHRHGSKYIYGGVQQHQVSCRFISWHSRDMLYQTRKLSHFIMKADITSRREEIISYARNKIASDSEIKKMIQFAAVDKNCLSPCYFDERR